MTRPASTRTTSGSLRPLAPSPELAAIVGDEPLARTEMVKRVWAYIRENGCQNPADRRVIVCDDRLRAVFGRDRLGMLAMMGLLSPHLRVRLKRSRQLSHRQHSASWRGREKRRDPAFSNLLDTRCRIDP